MRIDIEKYLIAAPTSIRDAFFETIQKLGIAEFIGPPKTSKELPSEVQVFFDALHILKTRVPSKQPALFTNHHSGAVLARQIVEHNDELERLREQKRIIDKEISRIEPFGHFSLEEIKLIERKAHRKFQFFFVKEDATPEAIFHPEVIKVGYGNGLNYFLTINRETTHYPGLVEVHIDQSLDELEQERAHLLMQIDEVDSMISSLSYHEKFLRQELIDSLNQYHLHASKEQAQVLEGGLFVVEAWIPKNKVDRLKLLADEMTVIVENVSIESEDRVPTYLENKGTSRLGEDLVGIYDTPSTSDKDPSNWVFFAFGLFFAMIVADAGYGLILLSLSLFCLYRFGKKSRTLRRVLKLSTFLSIGCILWGILSASYFGIPISLDNPVRKISLIDWMAQRKASYVLKNKGSVYEDLVKQFPAAKTATTPKEFFEKGIKVDQGRKITVIHDEFVDNVMIELVIFIGTVHIILSLLRYIKRNWAAFGWCLFMIGGYLYFPSILKAISFVYYIFEIPSPIANFVGQILLYGGMALAWGLAIVQKRLGGLAEITHVIQIFADVMSYLRIYALSLAGIVMASTFNHIGTTVPLWIGIFIIFAGHTVNFILALMGGIIHGLRLNFIEWYHYSFEGGGRPFRPLSLLEFDS